MKTMNNKMAINTCLSTIESKKHTKQEELSQKHGYGKHFDGCQMGGGEGIMSEEVRGLRSTNRHLQNSHGDEKYSIGNGAAEELICMTHGHEQWWGYCLREWGCWVEGGKGGIYWDNCNSIINKIYCK